MITQQLRNGGCGILLLALGFFNALIHEFRFLDQNIWKVRANHVLLLSPLKNAVWVLLPTLMPSKKWRRSLK